MLPLWLVLAGLLLAAGPASSHRGEMEPGTGGTGGGLRAAPLLAFPDPASRSLRASAARLRAGLGAAGGAGAGRLGRGGAVVRTRC